MTAHVGGLVDQKRGPGLPLLIRVNAPEAHASSTAIRTSAGI